jgi:hypothetical protein
VRDNGFATVKAALNAYSDTFYVNGSSVRIILDETDENSKNMFAALNVPETS